MIAPPLPVSARTAATETLDVLAYLARKKANALMMLEHSPEFTKEAVWSIRTITVLEDDIRALRHEGEAQQSADSIAPTLAAFGRLRREA
jgi:hypothetical protein